MNKENLNANIAPQEKPVAKKISGVPILFATLFFQLVCLGLAIFFGTQEIEALVVPFVFLFFLAFINYAGLKSLKPQEARVLTLYGDYYGTLKGPGLFYVHPFCSSYNPAGYTKLGQSVDVQSSGLKIKDESGTEINLEDKKVISLKLMTLNNNRQKINDVLGNPVEISIAVIWRVKDTAKAVFAVDNYKEFLSLQCDSALRNVVRAYPYDITPGIDTDGDGLADEGSLRGSSNLVAEQIKAEIQEKVQVAGLEVVDARITYLAYAPEIASAMLRRQQASAVIDARTMIVDGAVSMIDMALKQLEEQHIVHLDDERKAAMVSNLLVVLSANEDPKPVINSGSIY